jgi:hypothetical protein
MTQKYFLQNIVAEMQLLCFHQHLKFTYVYRSSINAVFAKNIRQNQ